MKGGMEEKRGEEKMERKKQRKKGGKGGRDRKALWKQEEVRKWEKWAEKQLRNGKRVQMDKTGVELEGGG